MTKHKLSMPDILTDLYSFATFESFSILALISPSFVCLATGCSFEPARYQMAIQTRSLTYLVASELAGCHFSHPERRLAMVCQLNYFCPRLRKLDEAASQVHYTLVVFPIVQLT